MIGLQLKLKTTNGNVDSSQRQSELILVIYLTVKTTEPSQTCKSLIAFILLTFNFRQHNSDFCLFFVQRRAYSKTI